MKLTYRFELYAKGRTSILHTDDIAEYGDVTLRGANQAQQALKFIRNSLTAHLTVIDGLKVDRCLIAASGNQNKDTQLLEATVIADHLESYEGIAHP